MDVELGDPGLQHPRAHGRIRSAQATLAAIEPRKHLFGITRVADVTGLDRVGIPVAIAIRPSARSVAVSQGKGIDLASAKVSALMEAIEVWHAENIEAPLVLASIADVAGRSCEVARLPIVAGSSRPDHARLLWITGRDLVSGQSKLVPFEMVHADYAPPLKPGYGLFPASTNGLASGNHELEATSSAICEVIERDSLAVWHATPLERRSSTRIDSTTIEDAECRWARDRILSGGLELALWDVTSDLGVATFLCLIHDAHAADQHIGLGSGTHPDANVALMRALTEAAQTRLTYITGSRDDLMSDEFTPFGLTRKRRLADMLLQAGPPSRGCDSVASHIAQTLHDETEWLLGRLTARGIKEVIAVDLSKTEIGIPVMRVVIPGLEAPHDEQDYVPGPRAGAADSGARR